MDAHTIRLSMLAGISVILASCATENFLSDVPSARVARPSCPEGSLLLDQMQVQPGSYDRFLRVLDGKTPLYEHTFLSSSTDYGLYYLVPDTRSDGTVKGCIIYPTDEDKSFEQRKETGTLGMPVDLDSRLLNEGIPECRRYLYAWRFRDLENQGLSVDSNLTTFARYMEEKSAPAQTRAGSNQVSSADVTLYYQVSSFGYVPPQGAPTVSTVSIETIINAFKSSYQWHRVDGCEVILDVIRYNGFRCLNMKLSCNGRTFPLRESFLNDLKQQINKTSTFIKQYYYVDIVFQYHYILQYKNIGGFGGGSSGNGYAGTKDTSQGIDLGGFDPSDPNIGSPCRNTKKGKANPLIGMGLMPPNDANIRGARFGYTRTERDGSPKFHQGIDLVAIPGTPSMPCSMESSPARMSPPNQIE